MKRIVIIGTSGSGKTTLGKELTWERATHIIWLDYNLLTVLKRFFVRSIKRSLTKEELWSGNTESLRNSIFSRDSLFFWILKTHEKHQKEYSELDKKLLNEVKLVRLRSPKETETFFNRL